MSQIPFNLKALVYIVVAKCKIRRISQTIVRQTQAQ